MDLSQLGSLWLGRLDNILQYVRPERIILFAATNKQMLGYIQGYFSRIAKKYPCWKIDKKEGEAHQYSWNIKDVIMQNALIWMRSRIFDDIILMPKSQRRNGRALCIYGWVIWDKTAKHEFYGKYPTWVQLMDSCLEDRRIIKIIPYR